MVVVVATIKSSGFFINKQKKPETMAIKCMNKTYEVK